MSTPSSRPIIIDSYSYQAKVRVNDDNTVDVIINNVYKISSVKLAGLEIIDEMFRQEVFDILTNICSHSDMIVSFCLNDNTGRLCVILYTPSVFHENSSLAYPEKMNLCSNNRFIRLHLGLRGCNLPPSETYSIHLITVPTFDSLRFTSYAHDLLNAAQLPDRTLRIDNISLMGNPDSFIFMPKNNVLIPYKSEEDDEKKFEEKGDILVPFDGSLFTVEHKLELVQSEEKESAIEKIKIVMEMINSVDFTQIKEDILNHDLSHYSKIERLSSGKSRTTFHERPDIIMFKGNNKNCQLSAREYYMELLDRLKSIYKGEDSILARIIRGNLEIPRLILDNLPEITRETLNFRLGYSDVRGNIANTEGNEILCDTLTFKYKDGKWNIMFNSFDKTTSNFHSNTWDLRNKYNSR